MTDPPPSDYTDKVHAERTQGICFAVQGQQALRWAYDAIPPGDMVKAEWFGHYLADAVWGDITIVRAMELYAEKCK